MYPVHSAASSTAQLLVCAHETDPRPTTGDVPPGPWAYSI